MTEQTQNKNSLYFGGVPTEPDINKIRQHYPQDKLEVNQLIPYSDIENLLGYKKNSCRFRTVTNRWRRIVERETGKVIGAKAGEGFIVLDDSGKLDMSGDKLRTAVRHVRRSMRVSSLIDREQLSDGEVSRLDHMENINTKLSETARLESKAELPKITE